jgi:hypothetical protein
MDDLPDDDVMIEAVDGRSAELIGKARRYIASVRRTDPRCSERLAFEGWAIQELASLQLLVELLNMQFGKLGVEMERKRSPKKRKPGR